MPRSWAAVRQRSKMYRSIRQYFDQAGFLEVETPALTPSPIPESHIELFKTDSADAGGGFRRLFLIPSPEVWMKLLLADGAPSLYQISKCFRSGEQIDTWHRSEFSMLEWYEIGIGAAENLKRMRELLAAAYQALEDRNNPPPPDFRIMTMNQAFEDLAGFSLEDDLRNAGCGDSSASPEDISAILSQRLAERNLPLGDGSDKPDDLFHRLFIALVENRLPADGPLILKDWPALVPTLACRIPGTPWADRWEMYYHGVEVANCYTEENSLEALLAYWKENSPVSAPSGEEWPRAIAEGMPRCSGAAVGLDRLLALLRGDDSLRGLDLFPFHDMMPEN